MVNVIVSSAGVQGPRGNTILPGTGAPSSTVGIDGDYYIDLTNYPTSAVFYGPRVSGSWPGSGITLSSGGGGGAVSSVNGLTGAVVLAAIVTSKSNLTAVAAPTVNSDGTAGYAVGSIWVNTATGVPYICGGAATGAAVWTPLLPVGTSAGTVAAGNDTRIVNAIQPTNAATTVVAGTGYGQASTVGTDTTYAREDHSHGTPPLTSSAPATTLGIGQAGAVGTATTPARADHVHPLAAAGAPAASAVTSTQVTGVATTFAASDHVHAREGFGAVTAQTTFGAASASGTATTVSHSDHTHGTPTLPTATTSTSGIVQLDGTAGDIAPLGVQAAGAVGKAADAGHVHAMPTLNQVGAPTAAVNLNSQKITGQAAGVSATDGVNVSQLPAPASGSAQGLVQLAGDLGGTASAPTVVSTHLASALPVGQGGTGQTTTAAAYNALAPTTTLGDIAYASGVGTNTRLAGSTSATKQYLQQTGTGSVSAAPAWGTIQAGDIPTLNQNTTGTAANVTGTVAVANGGTGATTATAALAALSGTPISAVRSVTTATVTANAWDVLECNATTQAITVTLPTNVAGVKVVVKKMDSTANTVTITGTIDGTTNPTLAYQYGSMELVADGTNWVRTVRPSLGALVDYPAATDARYVQASGLPLPIASGGTGQATQQAALNAIAGATTSGSYLRGTGSNVAMSAIQAADLPAATTSVQGAVQLDGTAGDIKALASSAAAGASGKAADASHVHPTTGLVTGVTAADTSVVVGGTSGAPTLRTATLDVIAAQHPPVAAWSNNGQKITSVANGSAATDVLAFGQLPPVTIVAGATGTYATDVANIGAAVAAAGANGVLYFPYGTYSADGLAPLPGQTWYGPATIQRPTSSTASIITATGISGFTMRQLVIDGNSASSASSNAAVYLINTSGTQLSGITVQNCPATNAAIILRGSVRGLVDACQITSVGYGVLIGLNHGDAYSCYANVIRNCLIDTTVADAIFLSENLGSTTSVSVVGSVIGTVVTGCTVRNFGDCGIEIGSGTLYTEVSGCAFIGISNGSGNNGILFRDALHGNVTGCTVSNLTKTGSTGVYMVNLNGSNQHNSVNSVDCYNVGYGYIVVGGTSGSSVGTAATDIAFNGGVIDTTALDGIHLNNVAGFNITGTQVHNAGQQGISVGKFGASSATDGTITGARVFNSSQQTTGDSGIIIFQNSADIVITGCRIGDNQGASKTQAYGIRIYDTTVSNVTISNTDLTNGGTTANFSSAPAAGSGIQLLNCPGTTPSSLPNVTTQPGAAAEPSDHGLIAWAYDAGLASQSSTQVSAGTLYLTAVYPRQAFNSTKVYFSVGTIGVTPTSGENWIGLYNTSGTLLASKGIDTNITTLGLQTVTWTTATGTQPAGQYWIGFFFNAATEPFIYRAPTPADNATQNVNLTTTNYRMCQQAGGFTTALPSPLTVSSNSISGGPRLWWVALG